ncbi:MAG TPA: hypothetical protein VFC39_21825 [Acidobacteriaceae bacterium]|nr:hypothetical protein [Acidobacteriaceae bacterium]
MTTREKQIMSLAAKLRVLIEEHDLGLFEDAVKIATVFAWARVSEEREKKSAAAHERISATIAHNREMSAQREHRLASLAKTKAESAKKERELQKLRKTPSRRRASPKAP